MNQIIMIILISLLVLVHEIGHFIAARMCGIRVTRFGIGMPIGPSWKLFKIGHTVFYIHAFLFGGYVSFADDEPEDQGADDSQANGPRAQVCEASIQQARSLVDRCEDRTNTESSELSEDQGADDSQANDEVLPKDSEELYENKTIAQKLFVVSAGVIMNVVFAIILVLFCAAYYHKLPTSNQNVYVDSFAQKTTSDAQAKGIKKGDKFLKINSSNVKSLYQLTFFAKNSKMFDDYAQADLYEKNLKELKKLNPKIKDEIKEGQTIVLPSLKAEKPLVVNENILKGLEKYKKDGIELSKEQIDLRNKIYSKNSHPKANSNSIQQLPKTTMEDVALVLSDTYKPMNITVLRDNKEVVIENVKVEKEGMLGIFLKIEDVFTETKTIKDVFVKSFDYIWTTTTTMLYGLWQLFTGKVSASDMHGVIAVVKVGGDIIASKGMLNGILLTAMISINLAIMNFLPIPALDGGHVMFLMIEKITGKKPSKEFGEKITNFFFILLIILMVAICYNDIFALVTKKF